MNSLITDAEYSKYGRQVAEYCRKYSIPLGHFIEIISDQKVVPMLRGKGTEFAIYDWLNTHLDKSVWLVEKPDMNAQSGTPDIDVRVTYRPTNRPITLETKNAVRGSMRSGRPNGSFTVPYYQVKCHRSRSNMKLASSTNDRYTVNDFDILISNPLNAVVRAGKGKSSMVNDNGQLLLKAEDEAVVDPTTMELIDDQLVLDFLYRYYGVNTKADLIQKMETDFRFAVPSDIATNGIIPRTPYVIVENDSYWKPLAAMPKVLEAIALRPKTNGR